MVHKQVHLEGPLVVDNLGVDWGFRVDNFGVAPAQQLALAVRIVVVHAGAVIDHGADVGELVGLLGVGVEVEEDAEALEAFGVAKGSARLEGLLDEPDGHPVSGIVWSLGLDVEGCLNKPV